MVYDLTVWGETDIGLLERQVVRLEQVIVRLDLPATDPLVDLLEWLQDIILDAEDY